ncbi:TPR-like protein [Lindgomyces ingoldianus]|uniref:TPR-like protein n=1 Tax=Lindgomyces ingoldianus TaxID=673940 RepID=A0ACB6QHC9_9PLEO|nr:TPR-like protein [Lindgomyces ingoldianus]KAF2466286.1 TPR-like protein [Lindgomyces ingoldianus]
MQSQDRWSAAGLIQVPHSFDPIPALHIPEHHGTEPSSTAQTMPVTSMDPPTRPRKRKAPTLPAVAWEPYKARILELHNTEGLPLREVKEMIKKEFGFTAEIRQYRTRISQWGKDKNIKPEEMKAIVRKRQERKLVESSKRELVFTVRGSEVEPQKINRWMKRNNVRESLLYAPTTPSAVRCQTISERDSPVPNSAFSPAAPIFSPESNVSIAQSPQIFSPALSIASIVRPQSNTFMGKSPAPTYQYLPSFPPGPVPSASAFQGQVDSVATFVPYRYRQKEEERLREELLTAETLFGTYHSGTLGILYQLGEVLIDQGRYKSAEEVIRRLLERRQAISGNDDVNTLNAFELLGQVLRRQGLYAKAEKLFRRTFGSRSVILGVEHGDTLNSMNNLGLTYMSQGRWKEAEELGVQRRLGEEHPNTLTNMGNLALTYKNQGRWKEAEELEVQVVETRKRVLGEEHPHTLNSMANLAHTWKSQSRNEEAILLMEECFQLQKHIVGPYHPHTESSLEALSKWQLEKLNMRL